jgi:hypothetical protein
VGISSIAAAMEDSLRQHCRDNLPLVTAQMVEATQAAASRRTGALAASIGADEWADEGTRFTSVIYAGRDLDNPDVARFQDEGTGIYGPEGQRITAHGGGVLAFDWPAAGGVVFFRSVAGAPGRHYFIEPMPDRYREAMQALWA